MEIDNEMETDEVVQTTLKEKRKSLDVLITEKQLRGRTDEIYELVKKKQWKKR